jgi:hypothetical protein
LSQKEKSGAASAPGVSTRRVKGGVTRCTAMAGKPMPWKGRAGGRAGGSGGALGAARAVPLRPGGGAGILMVRLAGALGAQAVLCREVLGCAHQDAVELGGHEGEAGLVDGLREALARDLRAGQQS